MERFSARRSFRAGWLGREGPGPEGKPARRAERAPGWCGLVLLALAGGESRATVSRAGPPDGPAIEHVLQGLLAKYKQNDKKFETLVAKVDKAVRKALATTAFPGSSPEAPRFLDSHPFVKLVDELAAAAKAEAGKTSAGASELLTRFPWGKQLELAEGLQYGSDRPIPKHENGFIDLGDLPEPHPGFPELSVNQYLYGLHEIVGWDAGVEQKKQLAFRGRGAKDPAPGLETALPVWEALRVYLQGSLPEVSLFAIPRLTHVIHARLAERRRVADGKAAQMDEMLALLDGRWNGFSFQTPYSKARIAIALPIFGLIADRKGFVYRFPTGAQLATSSDIPFVSDLTLMQYAQVFRNEKLEVHDFIAGTPPATAARGAFWQDCVYLGRYRALIEVFVRALLAPGFALPSYMDGFDWAGGTAPAERAAARALDVPRKHVLALWAFAGRDPIVLADFLHEHLLSLEINRFPKNASLQSELSYLARKRDNEVLASILARAGKERGGDFEREFSPHAVYLDASSEPATGYLVHSFQTFHALVADVIRETANAVVMAELEK